MKLCYRGVSYDYEPLGHRSRNKGDRHTYLFCFSGKKSAHYKVCSAIPLVNPATANSEGYKVSNIRTRLSVTKMTDYQI